jgi:RanBP1 domain
MSVLMDIVPINDGEEGEATILQLRAKLFTFVKGTGWKERGAGNLKLNVPRSYVDYDENGIPVPGSFDPSARDDSDEEGGEPGPTSARLIMRQDNTHRVILNTVILKGLKFEEKSSTSGAPQIMFTAFEEAKPVNMLLRVWLQKSCKNMANFCR